jgi:hypothetical protein
MKKSQPSEVEESALSKTPDQPTAEVEMVLTGFASVEARVGVRDEKSGNSQRRLKECQNSRPPHTVCATPVVLLLFGFGPP